MAGKHQHSSGSKRLAGAWQKFAEAACLAGVQRRLLAASLLVVLCALCVGGTLAYFTAQSTAHNVITASGVVVKLQEWQEKDGQLVPYPQDEAIGVMPGTGVSKRPVAAAAENSADAWVRMRVTPEIALADGSAGNPDLMSLDCNTDAWTYNASDGWWYYGHALKAGKTTKPLFNSVNFAGWMPNDYQYATAHLVVDMQAVQVANNGASALDAQGWPAVGGQGTGAGEASVR